MPRAIPINIGGADEDDDVAALISEGVADAIPMAGTDEAAVADDWVREAIVENEEEVELELAELLDEVEIDDAEDEARREADAFDTSLVSEGDMNELAESVEELGVDVVAGVEVRIAVADETDGVGDELAQVAGEEKAIAGDKGAD